MIRDAGRGGWSGSGDIGRLQSAAMISAPRQSRSARAARSASGPSVSRARVAAGAVAAWCVGSALLVAPAAAAGPDADPYVPPSETVQTPVDRRLRAARPSRRRRSTPPRTCPPASPRPQPLPVPAKPVGGGRLGECGLIVPDGAPPLPSDISAGAWMIADLDTGEVLAAKDPHGRYRPASTLKLLTVQATAEEPDEPGPDRRGHRERRRPGRHPGRHRGRRQVHRPAAADLPDHHLRQRRRERAGQGQRRLRQDHRRHERHREGAGRAGHPGGHRVRAGRARAVDVGLRPGAVRARRTWRPRRSRRSSSSVDVRVPAAGRRGLHRGQRQPAALPVPGRAGRQDRIHRRRRQHLRRDGRAGRPAAGRHDDERHPAAAAAVDAGARRCSTGASRCRAGTPPVGKLVDSLAEATAVAAPPTPSTGAPPAPAPGSAVRVGDPTRPADDADHGDRRPSRTARRRPRPPPPVAARRIVAVRPGRGIGVLASSLAAAWCGVLLRRAAPEQATRPSPVTPSRRPTPRRRRRRGRRLRPTRPDPAQPTPPDDPTPQTAGGRAELHRRRREPAAHRRHRRPQTPATGAAGPTPPAKPRRARPHRAA